jgi:hypothetical protein
MMGFKSFRNAGITLAGIELARRVRKGRFVFPQVACARTARGINGNVYQTGATLSERWRYDRGRGKFPVVLTIAEGRVQAIEFEKTWD